MKNVIRFGLFLAAGYGTYEILRRTGALKKAGDWLQDQVPDEMKAKIQDQMQHARDQVAGAKDRLQKAGAQAGEQLSQQYDSLRTKATEQYGTLRDQATQYAKKAGEQFDQVKQNVTSRLHPQSATAGGPQSNGGQQPVSNNAGMQPPVENESDSVHSTDSAVGQTITGPGRGTDDATAEVNGGSVHHRVGRGVIHG